MSFFIRKRGGGQGKLTDRVGGGVKRKYPTGERSSSSSSFKNRGRGGARGHGKDRKLTNNHDGKGSSFPKSKYADDEITSESDDDNDQEEREEVEDGNSDVEETEQEARVRLAKQQIAELKKKLNTEDDEAVSELLREESLEEHGKVLKKLACLCSPDSEVQVKPIVTGKIIKTAVTSMCVCSSLVFCSTKSGVIVKYDTSACTRSSVNLNSPVNDLACTPDNLIVSTPECIVLCSTETLQVSHKYANSRDSSSLCVSSDSIFSTHKDRTVKVWSVRERAYVESLFGHQDIPTCVSSCGSTVISAGGFDSTLRLWKLETDSQLVFNFNEIIEVVCLLNNRFFAGGGVNGSIGLFSTGRKKPLDVVTYAHGATQDVPHWITCLSGNGDLLASGSDTGVVKLWRVTARKLEFIRDLNVGEGVVVGIHVVLEGEETSKSVRLVVALSTEHPRGRWGGRKRNCSKIVIVDC